MSYNPLTDIIDGRVGWPRLAVPLPILASGYSPGWLTSKYFIETIDSSPLGEMRHSLRPLFEHEYEAPCTREEIIRAEVAAYLKQGS